MSSQKSDGIVKRRAPKPRSKPIEVADDFEGAYEDFTALAESSAGAMGYGKGFTCRYQAY